MKPYFLALLPLLLVAGCANQPPVQVVDRSTSPVRPSPPAAVGAPGASGSYTVKKGDSLYRVALDHGVYYRDLAAWNNITDPNSIKEGQVLRISPPTGESTSVISRPVGGTAVVESRPLNATPSSADGVKREPRVNKEPYSDAAWERQPKSEVSARAEVKPDEAKVETKPATEPKPTSGEAVATPGWAWPVAGKVTTAFGENGNKGIEFAGKDGDAIMAAADGKVFFVGPQKGYGNLLIIGHTNGYISVYAHNRKVLVTEKQQVTKGQKVAEMGKSDSENGVKLHFEIRQQGKPVDPATYLPKR